MEKFRPKPSHQFSTKNTFFFIIIIIIFFFPEVLYRWKEGKISIICLLVLSDIGQEFYNSTDIDLVLLRGESWSESPSPTIELSKVKLQNHLMGLGSVSLSPYSFNFLLLISELIVMTKLVILCYFFLIVTDENWSLALHMTILL